MDKSTLELLDALAELSNALDRYQKTLDGLLEHTKQKHLDMLRYMETYDNKQDNTTKPG